MKKNILLTICLLVISFLSFAGKLVLVPVTETHNLESLFNDNNFKIHYYCDDYVLATTDVADFSGAVVLDEDAFAEVSAYAIVYCYESQKEEYLSRISNMDEVLYSGNNFLIMKILSNEFSPAKNDGMVAITNTEARLPVRSFDFPVVTEIDPFVHSLVEIVNTDTLISYVQHLQDYGTRVYFKPKAYEAQDWLISKYEALGLEAEIHEFSAEGNWWGLPATTSGNVIAIQTGKVRPDEFIVCGSHYDSFVPYSSYENCPGADDNATGTAGILEIARILSQYEFESSIIYCNFSAEEVGLCGSAAYASYCYQQGMNIVGYFNIDMSGYLQSGSNIHIDLIHPASANPLANYYKNIANVYFPAIPVTSYPGLSGGDSDHTSFNQKGYMGIYPFEDRNNYSPYIHTTNDKIGPSVNTPEQVRLFTQVSLASIATLAISMGTLPPPIEPPTNCVAEYIENQAIKVTWEAPETVPCAYYNVYRNDVQLLQTLELSIIDSVENYDLHCYAITAVFNVEDEFIESDFSNESCASLPLPFPTNCLAQHIENENILVTWEPPAVNILLEYYNVYRDNEKIVQAATFSYIDTLNDNDLHCYKVTVFYHFANEIVESEFSNESCDSVPFVNISENHFNNYKIYPNPTTGELTIENGELAIENVEIFDIYGRKLLKCAEGRKDERTKEINISHLPAGIFFVKIYTKAGEAVKKVVKCNNR